MDQTSLRFRKFVLKMSGMNKKRCSAKFEDDNDNLIAECSTGTSSINADDEREENGRTKRQLTMETLDCEFDIRRIRHGIANSRRAVVWQFISGGRDLLLANPGIYSLLLSNEFSLKSESEKLIVKDIHRILPSHELFQTVDGPSVSPQCVEGVFGIRHRGGVYAGDEFHSGHASALHE